jgi:hypothetical protein
LLDPSIAADKPLLGPDAAVHIGKARTLALSFDTDISI